MSNIDSSTESTVGHHGEEPTQGQLPQAQPGATPVRGLNRLQGMRIVFAIVLGVLIGQAGVVGYGTEDLGMQSRAERVYLDLQTIASGLRAYSDDGQLQQHGLGDISWMYGPGQLPAELPFQDLHGSRPLSDVNGSSEQRFIQLLVPDPWGNAYLANVDGLQAGTQRIKVLSAGPNGVIDTSPSQSEAVNDDVLIHLF